MAAFRPLGQFVQYLTDSGAVNASGTIETFETDLTTNKLTYSDPDLSVPNPFIIPLDSSGRPEVDVWGDGAYGMVMKTALGVTITTLNNIQSDSPVVDQIPALVAGQFLTNNGSILQWGEVIQVPDPTGLADYILTSDGDNAVWTQAPDAPVVPDPEIVRTGNGAAGSFQAGTSASTTKHFEQWGQATAPANAGAKTTSEDVVFPVAFVDTPRIFITMRGSGFTNAGSYPDLGLSADSNTGFTVKFDSQRGESNSDMNLSSAIPFSWHAIGTLVVP